MTKQRWKDSLGPTDDVTPEWHTRTAIFWLGYAIDKYDQPDRHRRGLRGAGAHIRAARKGLGVKSQRIGDFYSEDAALLTSALRDVVDALDAHTFADGGAAHLLRRAEAALRTIWKRGQA